MTKDSGAAKGAVLSFANPGWNTEMKMATVHPTVLMAGPIITVASAIIFRFTSG